MNVILPWPDRRLSPNARTHFREKARLVRLDRQAAYALTLANLPTEGATALLQGSGPVTLSITFHPPDRRARDLDNMLSASKALLDGVADALRVDDCRFELHLRRGDPMPKFGAVHVAISAG